MHEKIAMDSINATRRLLLTLFLGLNCFACSTTSTAKDEQVADTGQAKLFIVGQDLGSIREFYESACCIKPDGNTAYVSLYNLLSEGFVFSGLGIDPDGKPLDIEPDTGTGPQSAWKTATEFSGGLAIGLELAENNHPQAMSHLLEGQYDEHIRHLARFIKMINKPVWLRVAYEFDGTWNRGYEDAKKYKAVFRYVVDKLRELDVKDVEYVWQASASPIDDVLDRGHDDILRWYPGDDYVDWMGVSWFLAPDEKPVVELEYQPPTQRELADEVIKFARARSKPVMIAEAAPQAYDLARGFSANITPIWDGPQKGDKAKLGSSEIWKNWYAPLFQYMNDNDDVIRALAYINANWDAQARWGEPHNEGYWGDSRLEADPEIAKRFNQAMREWREY